MNPSLPQGYVPLLDLYHTNCAISRLKETLLSNLQQRLNLTHISAPLLVDAASPVADQFTAEQPITFPVPGIGATAEVVQSLNKWKRVALQRYHFPEGQGLCMDLNAIRWKQVPDNISSVYVDHWAWAKHIAREQRSLDTLFQLVNAAVMAICDAEITMRNIYPELLVLPELQRQVTFVTAQELEARYPHLTPTQRENEIAFLHRTVFVRDIGSPLQDGKPHQLRRPDTSEWPLGGKLIFWDPLLGIALPVGSIGIHVDGTSLEAQLTIAGVQQADNRYHNAIRAGKLPTVIGGSLGQSRLAMLILGKVHIGEVQQGIWDQATWDACREAGIPLL